MNFFSKIKEKIFPYLKKRNLDDFTLDEFPQKKSKEAITPEIKSERSIQRVFLFWIIWAVIVLLSYLAYSYADILLLIVTAFLLSIIVESLVFWFEKRKLSRSVSISFAYVLFFVFLVLCLVLILPLLIKYLIELITLGIGYVSQFEVMLRDNSLVDVVSNLSWIPDFFKGYLLDFIQSSSFDLKYQLQQNLSLIVNSGSTYLQSVGSFFWSFTTWFFNFFVKFGIVLTLSILFSVEKDIVLHFLARLFGKKHIQSSYHKIDQIYKKLAIWLKARFALSLFLTIAMYLFFLALLLFGIDIPYKLPLAVFLGLSDFIPYVGQFLWGLLVFLIASLHYNVWVWAIAIIRIYLMNIIQTNLIQPIFMGRKLGVSMTMIFICVLLGAYLLGFLWVLFSIPLAVIITLLVSKKK